jgi:hypothetical protein
MLQEKHIYWDACAQLNIHLKMILSLHQDYIL